MKCIDADKLKELLDAKYKEFREKGYREDAAYYYFADGLDVAKQLVESLQQEQPECSSNLVDVDAIREDFITEVYRVLDADPTNDRANAIINAFDSLPTVSREQPEVDLEKEIDSIYDKCTNQYGFNWNKFAIHFYELGLKARKKKN